jgi:hypothetical protein
MSERDPVRPLLGDARLHLHEVAFALYQWIFLRRWTI